MSCHQFHVSETNASHSGLKFDTAKPCTNENNRITGKELVNSSTSQQGRGYSVDITNWVYNELFIDVVTADITLFSLWDVSIVVGK